MLFKALDEKLSIFGPAALRIIMDFNVFGLEQRPPKHPLPCRARLDLSSTSASTATDTRSFAFDVCHQT
jgi:hypothetical protein